MNSNLFASMLIFIGFLDLLLGVLADKISVKITLSIGAVSFMIASLLRILDNLELNNVSYLFFGISIASINGSLQVWSLEYNNTYGKKLSDISLLGNIHICRRFAQALNIATPFLIAFNNQTPWILCIIFGFISLYIILSSNIGKKSISNLSPNLSAESIFNISALKKIALIVIAFGMIFYGIEFGIRNIIITPYVYLDLNDGNVQNLWLQVFVQVISGLSGNLLYNKLIKRYDTLSKTFLIGIALAIYGVANYVSYLTTSYYTWLLFSGFAVFSMGWYFPVLDALIIESCPAHYKTTFISITTAIYYIAGGIFLKLNYLSIDIDSFRYWWLISSYSLFIAAGIFLSIDFYFMLKKVGNVSNKHLSLKRR